MRNTGRHAAAPAREREILGVWSLTGTGFLGISCVLSLVLGFRTRRLPLLPLWEKGVGGDEGQRRSLSRAFINERSGAFGQPGYDLDPVPRQIRLSVASLQSCTVANRKYSSSHRG